jgi:hypothetical protein
MRKFMVLPTAALLALAIAAPVSAGGIVTNSSSSAVTAQGSYYADSGGVETAGTIYAWQDSGSSSAIVELYESSGEYVDCTPAIDTDDSFGFQGQIRNGSGVGTLTIGRGSSDAHASGTMDISTAVVDDCIGSYVETTVTGVAVELDLMANGPKIMERGTWSFHVPGEFNGHSSYTTTARSAAGTAKIGAGATIAVDGGIGKVSWRDHGNGG